MQIGHPGQGGRMAGEAILIRTVGHLAEQAPTVDGGPPRVTVLLDNTMMLFDALRRRARGYWPTSREKSGKPGLRSCPHRPDTLRD